MAASFETHRGACHRARVRATVGDAPEGLTEKAVNEMKTRGLVSSLRGAKRRSNPFFGLQKLDCFASLAMTV
jgi:hypothetical protein